MVVALSPQELAKDVLNSYRDEYKDLADNWKALDTKAQGTGAIAGVFLAAGFAWVRDLPAEFLSWQRGFLAFSLAFLALSILFALFALWVRTIPSPPLGEVVKVLTDDLLPALQGDESAQRATAFVNDQVELWRTTNTSVFGKSQRKGHWVICSQNSLFLAAGALALLAIASVLDS